MHQLTVKSRKREELIDITGEVKEFLDKNSFEEGVCYLYVPHTTAGITINEGADPSVKEDIVNGLKVFIPENGNYRHAEGNSDAHIKTSLIGSSEVCFVEKGRLALGTWQSIYFCEFDGPRERKFFITFMNTKG